MKCDGRMSFGDYVFPVNPYYISVSHQRRVNELEVPGRESVVHDMGKGARLVEGRGEFYGSDCLSLFEELKEKFEKGSGGVLYIPSQKPFYAIFEALSIEARDIEDVIQYSFRFIESFEKKSEKNRRSVISDGYHTLWDISYEHSGSVERLMELNPDIKRPDALIERGRRIYLC